ncbi:unnamed protein product [Prunus armeniaca]|uniref:Uncharacterized protein n=1 Tax=Prunus armeniaca TaxID=36596 RepID=A0A6J5U3S6_PRUAR|nr:hypothetical protein GBA52_007029 [Prunus armeniaca]CAB4270622.1 unnamed protein product [Prunus armeniaca]CAB4301021.1 unnamed protein product [Prunus armeniaca]
MENKSTKPVKKGKESKSMANIPPQRGQIKARIFGELIETLSSIAGGAGAKCVTGSSSGYYSDEKH